MHTPIRIVNSKGHATHPRPRSWMIVAGVTAAASLGLLGDASAQTPQTLNGPPVQVVPYVSEPGAPTIVITPGTLNPFAGLQGHGPGGGGGAGGGGAPSDALNTLLGTPWGAQAISIAQSLGVNPSAVAATCVLESGCQNLTGGTYTGAFQMGTPAYNAGIAAALAVNPALASQVVQGPGGRNDPISATIAASGYQMIAVQNLQNAGIANPTVLDTRGFYNFGPQYGSNVALAPDTAPMSQVLAGAPSNVLTGNHIQPGETVGQWRASVAGKVGNAAGQTVLL